MSNTSALRLSQEANMVAGLQRSELHAQWTKAHDAAHAAYERANARLETGKGGDLDELVKQYVSARQREIDLLNRIYPTFPDQ
jgi:hypothetical protein